MNIEELKIKHHGLYAQAVAEGETLGIKMMREKVCAVLPLTSKNKTTQFVVKNIREGVELNSNVAAMYTAIQMKAFNRKRREANHDQLLAAALEEALNVGKYG